MPPTAKPIQTASRCFKPQRPELHILNPNALNPKPAKASDLHTATLPTPNTQHSTFSTRTQIVEQEGSEVLLEGIPYTLSPQPATFDPEP